MATRMQQRRGTAAQWTSTNEGNGPILEVGEIGFETDTGKFKMGNGTDNWITLDYFLDESEVIGITSDYVLSSTLGQINGVATLDGNAKLTSSQIPSSLATTTYVDTAVSNLIDSAPGALNTLNELAAALNDDSSFSTTVTNALALKAPLASPTFTGTVNFTGATVTGISSYSAPTLGSTLIASGATVTTIVGLTKVRSDQFTTLDGNGYEIDLELMTIMGAF